MDGEQLFDQPTWWRAHAVLRLGLAGEDRIAGATTGARYPTALRPIAHALARAAAASPGAPGLLCDLGAGLGGASCWLAGQTGLSVVAMEESAAGVEAGRTLFPDLPFVQGEVQCVPLATGACAAATLLGVISLVDELDQVLDEVVRVLRPGGHLGVTDLCATGGEARPAGSPAVFRSLPAIEAALAAHGLEVVARFVGDAGRRTAWSEVGGRVERAMAEQHGGEPAFETWREDQRTIADAIGAGHVQVASVVAVSAPGA